MYRFDADKDGFVAVNKGDTFTLTPSNMSRVDEILGEHHEDRAPAPKQTSSLC